MSGLLFRIKEEAEIILFYATEHRRNYSCHLLLSLEQEVIRKLSNIDLDHLKFKALREELDDLLPN
jgi:hypothetical protein